MIDHDLKSVTNLKRVRTPAMGRRWRTYFALQVIWSARTRPSDKSSLVCPTSGHTLNGSTMLTATVEPIEKTSERFRRTTTSSRLPSEEIGRRGQVMYEREIRHQVEADHHGEIVATEVMPTFRNQVDEVHEPVD